MLASVGNYLGSAEQAMVALPCFHGSSKGLLPIDMVLRLSTSIAREIARLTVVGYQTRCFTHSVIQKKALLKSTIHSGSAGDERQQFAKLSDNLRKQDGR